MLIAFMALRLEVPFLSSLAQDFIEEETLTRRTCATANS